jgi:eukaryotic-like serine/threonine-protein kinase
MPELDAATLGQQAVKLGLITPDQLLDAQDEVGRNGDLEAFLRALERKGILTPWQSSKLLKGETDGYFLGGYRILYKIASGSFGRVYRGDDPRTGTVVAIKVLRRKWSEDKHSIELFEREGKLGMTLRHPNIVEILAVNRDAVSRQHYIVMEFVEGGNLRELLAIRKKLEPAEALRIMEEAAVGLAFAAAKGFTHRDMKLTNILISSQGKAKLVDFGLAGMEHLVHKDEGGQVDRTVDYAGLEKATGAVQGDPRSDIYFLGSVLYELLTGRAPLDMSRDARRRMTRERYVNVKPMTKEEVNGPPSVFHLVEKMMAYNPLERYQTASQLLEGIREVRRELDGVQSRANAPAGKSLFIVEKDDRLQDALRTKFKELGYRVFLSPDPARALDRYKQQPYTALLIDARTVGDDSIWVFDRIVKEAARHEGTFAGLLIVSEEQEPQTKRLTLPPSAAVLVQNVTLKQAYRKLEELLGNEPPPSASLEGPLTGDQ